MTQLNRISHRHRKPYSAPSLVVSNSSPEPTLEPASTMPGPIWRRAVQSEAGGSWMASLGSEYGSYSAASCAWDMRGRSSCRGERPRIMAERGARGHPQNERSSLRQAVAHDAPQSVEKVLR